MPIAAHNGSPALSVVLATPDRYQTIRGTVRHLRAQSICAQIELVIVAPSAASLDLVEQELAGFCRHRVVEAGAIRSVGSANALGVRHASAPVVALAEDHVFPAPDWAEALLKAHVKVVAAVGPVIRNANPQKRISWADLLISYGPWLDPAPAGPVDFLPGHNSSYKRSLLLEYGERLETMMEAETVLHWDLRGRGYELYLEPAAKIAHSNFARLGSYLPAQFLSGRMFAATRVQGGGWPVAKRLLYAFASPLIPLVRLARILRNMSRPGRPLHQALRVLPELLLGLSADALGQMLGYALGAGNAREKLVQLEFHRYRHA